MKRVWIGMGIGAALLVATIYALFYTLHTSEKIEMELQNALTASQAGNWPEASDKTEKAIEIWRQRRPVCNIFHPHDPLESIESTLQTLRTLTAYENQEVFHIRIVELLQRLACLRDCDLPVIDNIL